MIVLTADERPELLDGAGFAAAVLVRGLEGKQKLDAWLPIHKHRKYAQKKSKIQSKPMLYDFLEL